MHLKNCINSNQIIYSISALTYQISPESVFGRIIFNFNILWWRHLTASRQTFPYPTVPKLFLYFNAFDGEVEFTGFVVRAYIDGRQWFRTLKVSAELAQKLSIDPDTVCKVADSQRQTYDRDYRQNTNQETTRSRTAQRQFVCVSVCLSVTWATTQLSSISYTEQELS